MLSFPIELEVTSKLKSGMLPLLVMTMLYSMVSIGSASPSSLVSVHVPEGTDKTAREKLNK